MLGWFVGGVLALGLSGRADDEVDIFRSADLLRIAITLPEAGWEQLEQSSAGRGRAKAKAKAVVREGDKNYFDVAVQLKGFTSFQPLNRTPSLTLDFNQFVPGQKFHGLTKISLNNSLQDPSRLSEKLARELFAAAGVPVPRADHAVVSLNGRELGLYVLAEGYDKSFLRRHFQDASGNFYEGGTLQDVHRSMQLKSGTDPEDRSDVDRLLRAAREPDATPRYEALAAVLDLDRYFAMVAVESMLCHSDSYSMNRNNYRIYHHPATDRLVFLPHGMDRILGTHRSNLDLPVVPPARGVITRALLSTPEGRRRYVEIAEALFNRLFDPERLCRRVREIDAKIVKERVRLPGDRNTWGGSDRAPSEDAADLCWRIERRVAELKLQFSQRSNLLALTPFAEFNAAGAATLTSWRVQRVMGQPPVEAFLTHRDGRSLLRLQSSAANLHTTLYCRVAVPSGRYELVGHLRVDSPESAQTAMTLLRYHASDRFTTEHSRLLLQSPRHLITVQPMSAPEELEFRYEIRCPSREVWVDPSALELVRVTGAASRPGFRTGN